MKPINQDSFVCDSRLLLQSRRVATELPFFLDAEMYRGNSITNTDVVLAGFLVWLSWCEPHFTFTGMSSRCVGANRVRAADGGVETLVDI